MFKCPMHGSHTWTGQQWLIQDVWLLNKKVCICPKQPSVIIHHFGATNMCTYLAFLRDLQVGQTSVPFDLFSYGKGQQSQSQKKVSWPWHSVCGKQSFNMFQLLLSKWTNSNIRDFTKGHLPYLWLASPTFYFFQKSNANIQQKPVLEASLQYSAPSNIDIMTVYNANTFCSISFRWYVHVPMYLAKTSHGNLFKAQLSHCCNRTRGHAIQWDLDRISMGFECTAGHRFCSILVGLSELLLLLWIWLWWKIGKTEAKKSSRLWRGPRSLCSRH